MWGPRVEEDAITRGIDGGGVRKITRCLNCGRDSLSKGKNGNEECGNLLNSLRSSDISNAFAEGRIQRKKPLARNAVQLPWSTFIARKAPSEPFRDGMNTETST